MNKTNIEGYDPKKEKLEVGSIWLHKSENEIYILTEIDHDDDENLYAMVCMNDGKIWSNPEEDMEYTVTNWDYFSFQPAGTKIIIEVG